MVRPGSRKNGKRTPGSKEQVVGWVVLALLVFVAGTFAISGGLLAEVVDRTPGLRGLKRLIGLSEDPLFEIYPDRLNPAERPPEIRIAERLLPALPDPFGPRGVWVLRLTGKNEVATEWYVPAPVSALKIERMAGEPDALIVKAGELGAEWIYVTTYARQLRRMFGVRIVDVVEPANASRLWAARMPHEAKRISLGRGGWLSETSGACGFWAGKYYTELTLTESASSVRDNPSPANADEAALLQKLAGCLAANQLVYGGPFDQEATTKPTVVAVQQPTPQPVPTAGSGAQFAAVAGGQITSPKKIERYTDNLYEKVDGKEGMYRAFNFVELRFGQYVDSRSQAGFDVYLFDMGEPVNAFGIHMAERGATVESLAIGRDGYASGTSVFFCKDKYYVNVLGPPEGGKEQLETAKSIATAIAETIPGSDRPFWAEQVLPAEGRLPHSLKYEATSGLGFDFLQKVFRAEYKAGDQLYQLFVIKTADAAAAKGIFDKFAEATAKYDKVVSKQSDAEGEMMLGESMGVFTASFTKGVFFGGATECGDQALAVKQAVAFRAGLAADGSKALTDKPPVPPTQPTLADEPPVPPGQPVTTQPVAPVQPVAPSTGAAATEAS